MINITKNKGGFTLVEVIVVLVILAILAAILIPAMTGWVDKAKEMQYIADARLVYTAAQSAVSEQYGINPGFKDQANRFKMSDNTRCGRVSTNMLFYVQNNSPISADQAVDAAIAKQILKYLESESRSTARYKFTSQTRPSKNQAVTDYHTKQKQPGIIILYSSSGEVLMVEFGYEKYLVHIDENGLVCTKDGNYTNDSALNN